MNNKNNIKNYEIDFNSKNINNKLLILNSLRVQKYKVAEPLCETHLKINYITNEYGYRTKEFIENPDIITLGCSQTYGIGLHQHQTWPEIISKKMNMSVINLAQPGDSAQGQIIKAFKYFEKYGNPKYIMCVFPLFRMVFVHAPEKMNLNPVKNINEHIIQTKVVDGLNFQKYSKSPYRPEEIIAPELAVYHTHFMINILQQYCKTNNIKLIWNIYEDYKYIYSYIKENDPLYYENFCDLTLMKQGEYIYCEEHKDFINEEFFDYAADLERGQEKAHWGFHRHLHIVDMYIDFLNKKYNEVY